jgi:hypothetical protein
MVVGLPRWAPHGQPDHYEPVSAGRGWTTGIRRTGPGGLRGQRRLGPSAGSRAKDARCWAHSSTSRRALSQGATVRHPVRGEGVRSCRH